MHGDKVSRDTLPGRLRLEVSTGDAVALTYGIRPNERGPAKIARVYDRESNRTWGYVAVDNLARGPSLGGIRIAQDITAREVYNLAAAMTLKSAAAMLPLGGGKAGLVVSPADLAAFPDGKKRLMTSFGEALYEFPEYVPGPDMGTSEEDMQTLYEVFTRLSGRTGHGRGGVGRPPSHGGLPIDEWGITAHGLFASARVAERCMDGFRIEGARVIVQGYGNVGRHIADKLHGAGAKIVGAVDINRALFDGKGLDVRALSAASLERDGLKLYDGRFDREFGRDELDRILEEPCDILVPAARPDAITCANADRIRTRIVLQGANNPVHGVVEYYLQKRKGTLSLTDWIVNAGGVIGCAVELKMDADPAYRERVLSPGDAGRGYLEKLVWNTISENVREIFDRTAAASRRGEDKTFREHALQLAVHRLTDEKLRQTSWL
jgi:glutamate dehydrogenase/leucine dehydrogenase